MCISGQNNSIVVSLEHRQPTELLEEKRKRHEITVAAEPAQKPAPVSDLMEALKFLR